SKNGIARIPGGPAPIGPRPKDIFGDVRSKDPSSLKPALIEGQEFPIAECFVRLFTQEIKGGGRVQGSRLLDQPMVKVLQGEQEQRSEKSNRPSEGLIFREAQKEILHGPGQGHSRTANSPGRDLLKAPEETAVAQISEPREIEPAHM